MSDEVRISSSYSGSPLPAVSVHNYLVVSGSQNRHCYQSWSKHVCEFWFMSAWHLWLLSLVFYGPELALSQFTRLALYVGSSHQWFGRMWVALCQEVSHSDCDTPSVPFSQHFLCCSWVRFSSWWESHYTYRRSTAKKEEQTTGRSTIVFWIVKPCGLIGRYQRCCGQPTRVVFHIGD